jgi:hypothetical protein
VNKCRYHKCRRANKRRKEFGIMKKSTLRCGSGHENESGSGQHRSRNNHDIISTHFVRTISIGASKRPAIAAAPTAMPRDDHGYAVSITSAVNPEIRPGSGALKTADKKLRAQLSNVFRRAP